MIQHTKMNPVVDFLKDKKILFAVTDQANIRKTHNKLFDKVQHATTNLTKRLSNSIMLGDVKYFDSIDDAMSLADEYDIVIIQSVGNLIRHNIFLEHLNNYCQKNPDFYLIAFTLDWDLEVGTGWLECHHQLMVVNVDTWKKIGSPKFGEWETVTEDLPRYTRSEENFHDKYTPYWIKGEPGNVVRTRSKQGWSFIKAGLEKQLKIDNFSNDMRACRLYVYPEFESENLYSAYERKDSSFLNNSNQKRWIEEFLKPKNTIWIYNSEEYHFNTDLSSCQLYFGPAAGFKYLDALNHNPNIEFIFYDYNQPSLDWIKELQSTWDGNDYPKYLASKTKEVQKLYKYINETIDKNQQLLFDDFNGEENFKRLWQMFKFSKTTYIQGSVFDFDWLQSLLANFKDQTSFFYYSNIFATDFTSMLFDESEIKEKYKAFLKILNYTDKKTIVHGCDPDGVWT